MSGTIEEIKHAIMDCLPAIYPRGRTATGIGLMCFKGRTGADGQSLVGMGEGAKLHDALDKLVAEGKIVSYGEYGHGQRVFHYKTNERPPVVGQIEEIKLTIVECLRRIYPRYLVQVGIECECLNGVKGPNGTSLVGMGDAAKIKTALAELVAESSIDAHEKELNGGQIVHYKAKAAGSAIHNRPALRSVRKGAAPDRQTRSGQNGTLPEADPAPRRVDLTIPECEDGRNEFKETFSVPAKDTKANKSNEIKKEVAIAVAAFANAEGGRLFIGVDDGGKPVGLKKDLKVYKSLDGLQSAIRNSVMEHFGVLVDMKFGFSGEQYLVIEIPARKPRWVYVDSDFHVRYGNTSPRLNTQKAAEYQKEHG